jgi:hypothetical protein
MDLVTNILGSLTGLAAIGLGLLYIASTIHSDAKVSERVNAYTIALEKRMVRMERAQRRESARRYQLEGALCEAGIPIPPWPDMPDDDDGDEPAPVRKSRFVVQERFSRRNS